MLANEQAIPEILSGLEKNLEKTYKIKTIDDLIKMSKIIDDIIITYLTETIFGHLKYAAGQHPFRSFKKINEVEINGIRYVVNVAPLPSEHGVVFVALLDQTGKTKDEDYLKFNSALGRHGMYHEVYFKIPNEGWLNKDDFNTIVCSIFKCGYTWLEGKIREIIRYTAADLGMKLYTSIRTVIPEQLYGKIWFAAGKDDDSFYVIDDDISMSSLDTMALNLERQKANPYHLMCEILGVKMPRKDTFARIAVGENKCCDFTIDHSAYEEELPLVARAEESFFGSKHITICPISIRDKSYLVAVFSPEHKEDFKPALKAHQDRLSEIFIDSHDKLKKLVNMIDKKTVGMDWSYMTKVFYESTLKVLLYVYG